MVKRRFKRIISLYEVPGAIEVREMTKRVMAGKTVTCDVCGCHIDKDYYHVTIYHKCTECQFDEDDLDDNFGVEDSEYVDMCSPECLKRKLDEYIEKSNNTKDYSYFDIRHCANERSRYDYE